MMFKVFAWPCVFIFCFLTTPKYDLCEVGKAMNRVDPAKYVFASLELINETYMTSRKGIFRESPSLGK
jgi:hypothetical protein